MSGTKVDYTGQVFGRLTVLGEAVQVGKHRKLLCECTCGVTKSMYLTSIKAGALSCGCRQREIVTTHGQSRQRNSLYYAWVNMRSRCTDPNAKYFSDYGGRGIRVCPEWDNSFEEFQTWALSNGYAKGLTLDRRRNNEDYSPDNCRWVDRTTQQRNRRPVKGSSSKYVGVSFVQKHQRWLASIKIARKSINLGLFATELDAAKARDSYIIEHKLQNFTLNGVL
jgi:hypothetical protein